MLDNLIRKLFSYDPDTGVVTDKRTAREAGDISHGYRRVRVRVGKVRHELQAHRVGWFLHYGTWPRSRLDHENRRPADNRIKNLREATAQQNAGNGGPYKNNKLGLRGVCIVRSGRYQAAIRTEGRSVNLGTFDTAEEAAHVYDLAAKKVFGEFAKLNFP